jgi:hypothetical protein
MQRSISNQKPIVPFFYIVLYVIYSSLASIYPFLPPLLAVLFVLFSQALKRDDTLAILLISFCLLVFEANYGYILFSSIIYFYLQYKFIMPKIVKNFSCNICLKIAYVLFTYLGYFAFLTLISNIFLFESPELNFYVIYYMIIEFFIVSIL